jgi:hypothetical protein
MNFKKHEVMLNIPGHTGIVNQNHVKISLFAPVRMVIIKKTNNNNKKMSSRM